MEHNTEENVGTRRVAKTVVKRKAGAVRKPAKKAKKVKKSKVGSTAEVDALVLEHRENGRKLARSILRKWRVRMPMDEIDSVVDLSLCEAARRYDSTKGAAFMTFYFYHLRGHLVRTVSKAAQASNIFTAFAKSTGIDTSEWSLVDSETIWGYVSDESVFGQREVETPENSVLRFEKIEECRGAIAKLDALEQEIIERSFGQEQPLVDIAKTLGYSRCHISRVKKSALDRLKVLLAAERSEAGSSEPSVEKSSSRRSTSARSKTPRRRSRRRSIRGKTIANPEQKNLKVA